MQPRKQKTSLSLGLRLLCLTLLLLASVASTGSAGSTEPVAKIRIAILPCTDIVKIFARAQPLRAYLEQQTHRQIEIVVPNSLQEFKRTIQLGEADFAFQAPHAYLMLASLYDAGNLIKALTPEGASMHRGVIVTRRDSNIKKIEDLRGKRVLFGHRFSTAKWLAPKSLLESKGINLQKELKSYSHGDSCESIALSVYLGQSDAGAMCDYSFADLTENNTPTTDEVPPDALVAIGTTWEIPTWVFAARQGFDRETVTHITNALLKLDRRRPEYREILQGLELGGFVRANDHDFDALRNHLAETGPPRQ